MFPQKLRVRVQQVSLRVDDGRKRARSSGHADRSTDSAKARTSARRRVTIASHSADDVRDQIGARRTEDACSPTRAGVQASIHRVGLGLIASALGPGLDAAVRKPTTSLIRSARSSSRRFSRRHIVGRRS